MLATLQMLVNDSESPRFIKIFIKKMEVTTLETQRLLARRLTLDDTRNWMDFIMGENSLDYFNFVKPDRESCEWWIKRQLKRYEDDGFGLMALIVKETGEMAGQCGLLKQELEGKTEIEIGYSLIPRFRGLGYATEAAIAFRNLAFTNNLCESIISIIHVDNIASQKVAVKNGMTSDFITENYGLTKGIPHIVYRIMKKNWKE